MRSILLMLGTTIFITAGSVATISYAGPGHDREMNDQMGGHMDHMNDVLQILKGELGDKYDQPVPPATDDQLVSGKTIFNHSCATCHGERGKGDGPAAIALKQKPADFTAPEHSKFYSDQGRIYIIENGVAGTPMTAWKGVLSTKEILSVHAYIRSLRIPVKPAAHEHTKHIH